MVKRFKTPPSQGGITSSILVRVTTKEDCSLRSGLFYFPFRSNPICISPEKGTVPKLLANLGTAPVCFLADTVYSVNSRFSIPI